MLLPLEVIAQESSAVHAGVRMQVSQGGEPLDGVRMKQGTPVPSLLRAPAQQPRRHTGDESPDHEAGGKKRAILMLATGHSLNHLPSRGQGLRNRHTVGILEITTHRKPAGNPRDRHPLW